MVHKETVIVAILVGVICTGGTWVLKPVEKGEVGPEVPGEVAPWIDMVREKYEGTSLKIAAVSHPSQEAFEKMIPEFESFTGISVNIVPYAEAAYFDKILLIATGEEVPFDVIWNCPLFVPTLASKGWIVPIDDFIMDTTLTPAWFDWEDVSEGYVGMLSFDGRPYGAPVAGETVITCYRKDLFEEYNKEPPTTFDELLTLAKFFKEEVPEVEAGVSIRAAPSWEAGWSFINLTYPMGGEWLDLEAKIPKFSDPNTIAALEYYKELCSYGPEGIEAFSFDEAWTEFKMGRAAMLFECSAAAAGIENPEESVVVGKTGYVPVLAGPAGSSAITAGWGLSITSGSSNKEAAWAMIAWLSSRYNQEKYIEYGGVVSRDSGLEAKVNPYDEAILGSLEIARSPLSAELRKDYYTEECFTVLCIAAKYAGMVIAGELNATEACSLIDRDVKDAFGW